MRIDRRDRRGQGDHQFLPGALALGTRHPGGSGDHDRGQQAGDSVQGEADHV